MIFTTWTSSSAQEAYPADIFIPPMRGTLNIGGTFGELRPNHFHTGIDLSTGGIIGKEIVAIGDGYVSRIVVSPYGYGNALYITHPNGFTSVYGHLSSFGDELDSLVVAVQYATQNERVHEFFLPGDFPVVQGEPIGLSGNSGRSYGPHLHFEIRDAISERPINPLLFGIELRDVNAPQVLGLMLNEKIEASDGSFHIQKRALKVVRSKSGNYMVPTAVEVDAECYLSVSAIDRQQSSRARNGVYSLKAAYFKEGEWQEYFSFRLDELDFAYGSAVNSIMDYEIYQRRSERFYKLIREPGNALPAIDENLKDYWLEPSVEELPIRILLSDYSGNTSQISLRIRLSQTKDGKPVPEPRPGKWMPMGELHHINYGDQSITISKNGLYSSARLRAEEINSPIAGIKVYEGPMVVPKSFIYSVNLDSIIANEENEQKLFLRVKNGSSSYKYYKLRREGSLFQARPKLINDMEVVLDTNACTLSLLSFRKTNPTSVLLKVTDEMSGYANHEVCLDGEWIPARYISLRDQLEIDLPQNTMAGQHSLEIVVIDEAGNKSKKQLSYTNN